MKKLLIAIILLVGLQSYSQEVSTTEEEYNYLTKGYEQDILTGHDIKPGYQLKEIGTQSGGEFNFTLYRFIKNETNSTNAILVKRFDSKTKKYKYACLPINNDRLFSKFKGDFNTKVDSWFNFYDACIKVLISNIL